MELVISKLKEILVSTIFFLFFSHRNKYHFSKGNITVTFSTTNSYARKWFYPRYGFGRIHEPCVTLMVIDELTPNDIFFDVGAHLGYFSIIAAKICYKSKVHLFEMDENCWTIIKTNIELNNIKNIILNKVAVSNQNTGEFIPNYDSPNAGLRIVKNRATNKLVSSTTLDSYVANVGQLPTFIKIDVEGAELKVLDGMKQLLEENHPKLLIEVHTRKLRYYESNYRDLLLYLEGFKYQIHELESHRSLRCNKKLIDSSSTLMGNTMIYADS